MFIHIWLDLCIAQYSLTPLRSSTKHFLHWPCDPIPQKTIVAVRRMIAIFFNKKVFPKGAEFEYKD
jgi:hypothetical protein